MFLPHCINSHSGERNLKINVFSPQKNTCKIYIEIKRSIPNELWRSIRVLIVMSDLMYIHWHQMSHFCAGRGIIMKMAAMVILLVPFGHGFVCHSLKSWNSSRHESIPLWEAGPPLSKFLQLSVRSFNPWVPVKANGTRSQKPGQFDLPRNSRR